MNYAKIVNGLVVNSAVFAGPMPAGWADPADTWVQSDVAGTGWTYANGVFAPPPAPPTPPPTNLNVDAERGRRRALPATVTVSAGTFQVNMDDTSQANIQGLTTMGLYLSSASPSTIVPFRDFTNQMHNLTPADLISMGLQVASRVQSLYTKSWALKAMTPIPADYTADGYWP
jgi:hypothetical protein